MVKLMNPLPIHNLTKSPLDVFWSQCDCILFYLRFGSIAFCCNHIFIALLCFVNTIVLEMVAFHGQGHGLGHGFNLLYEEN